MFLLSATGFPIFNPQLGLPPFYHRLNIWNSFLWQDTGRFAWIRGWFPTISYHFHISTLFVFIILCLLHALSSVAEPWTSWGTRTWLHCPFSLQPGLHCLSCSLSHLSIGTWSFWGDVLFCMICADQDGILIKIKHNLFSGGEWSHKRALESQEWRLQTVWMCHGAELQVSTPKGI